MHVSKNRFLPLLGWLAFCCNYFAWAAPPDTMTVHFYLRDTFCTNQSLLIGNQIFDQYNPTGTVLLAGAATDGSDSLIHVELLYREPARVKLDQNLCAGDTLWVNGTPYHAGFYLGEETIEGGAANGCDSIIEVKLHVVTPPVSLLGDTLCPADFRVVNGVRYDRDHPAGTEVLPGGGSNGCDSIVTIALIFKDVQIDLGPDRAIVSGDTVCLQAVLNFVPASISWSPHPARIRPACPPACNP